MSITSEITRLQTAKAALKTVIESKGVSVPASAKLDNYASLVDSISGSGGGGDSTEWENIAKGMIDQTTQFDFPDGVFTSLTFGQYLFYGRSGLKSITIPNGVTTIGNNCFFGCSSLTSIVIPDSVTSLGTSAFQECTLLSSITLGSGLITIGQSAFQSCSALTSITIPSTVTNVGANFMRQCTSLQEVTMQPTTPPTIGANGFLQSSNLQTIYVPDESVSSYKSASGWSAFANLIKGIGERPIT